MKVRVPLMVQDPLTARYQDPAIRAIEGFDITREAFFLDGPITRRVAVLDFDPETGALTPGARFLPPERNRKLGWYARVNPRHDEWDIYSPEFIRISTFATVLKTIYMFEEPDALGRPLTWAFDAPQLLVVPRAGQWANAYYERASHSLQFFYFDAGDSERVYTGLSRDIVAHETGHAILDGIAPDLYDAITPQSLALHEAIADLTAALIAFRSHNLSHRVLARTKGSIAESTDFSSLAEEFGRALDRFGRRGYLRSLYNQRTLDPQDRSKDKHGVPNLVRRHEPHALSEVLSGALYTVMVKMHEAYKKKYAGTDAQSEYAVAGKALAVAADHFKRMIYRALDYLPPGEVSFADYGRAIIAADLALYPQDDRERLWIRDEFVRRHMVSGPEALVVSAPFPHPAVKDLDLRTLVESDWAAYDFANANRDLLRIPEGIPFHVRPRLDAKKTYYSGAGEQTSHECIFKVSWNLAEPNRLARRFPPQRQITVGTTLVIDWDTHNVRALLTTDHTEEHQHDRDSFLRYLWDKGLLRLEKDAIGPDRKEMGTAVIAEATERLMRVRGPARVLHIATEV